MYTYIIVQHVVLPTQEVFQRIEPSDGQIKYSFIFNFVFWANCVRNGRIRYKFALDCQFDQFNMVAETMNWKNKWYFWSQINPEIQFLAKLFPESEIELD